MKKNKQSFKLFSSIICNIFRILIWLMGLDYQGLIWQLARKNLTIVFFHKLIFFLVTSELLKDPFGLTEQFLSECLCLSQASDLTDLVTLSL